MMQRRCALAFANIGLAGSAVLGAHWNGKHRPVLLRQFTSLLQTEPRPAGLLLCEVGNLSELLSVKQRREFNTVLDEAFVAAGAAEHGNPQILWSKGGTVAAFRSDVRVRRQAHGPGAVADWHHVGAARRKQCRRCCRARRSALCAVVPSHSSLGAP